MNRWNRNPIGFIVELLQKKYPEQAGVSLAGGSARDLPGAAGDDDDKTDLEDEEKTDFAPKPFNRLLKRGGVSGESQKDLSAAEITEVPKSAAEAARIEEILATQTIFKHVAADQRALLARAMTIVEHAPGAEIITQGAAGDFFYALDAGQVDCFVAPSEDLSKRARVKTYVAGEAFGEIALMYNAPRAASCVATSACRLFALDRATFKIVLTKSSVEKRSKTKDFLSQVEILKEMKEYELYTTADAMTEVAYAEGDVVCRQGDAGHTFYIIAAGAAVCSQADAAGAEVEVSRLGVGNYFGEIALLSTKPRQATVSAQEGAGPLKLLALDRSTFTRILGSVEDILRRNMASYDKFRGQHV